MPPQEKRKTSWALWFFRLWLCCATAGICISCLRQGALAGLQDRVLLVIAHPDDESMFFSPTLISLKRQGVQLHVLCLSQGNAYGLGTVRHQELLKACKRLQVPTGHVRCINNPDLQDGMDTPWPAPVVRQAIQEAVDSWDITQIVTFDVQGVSGHINHLGVYQGVRDYLVWRQAQGLHRIPVWALASSSLIRKYLGCIDCLPTALLLQQDHVLLLNLKPWTTVAAMMEHRTQLVWYRWLFIMFSRYTWINTLQPLVLTS